MKGEDYQKEENEMISFYDSAPVRKHFRRMIEVSQVDLLSLVLKTINVHSFISSFMDTSTRSIIAF